MNKILCLIPARGGSKRIPGKNLLPLAGKPLLAYTIETALAAKLFSDIVVSSDDDQILQLASSYGITVDRRPDALCGDMVDSYDVVVEYLERPHVRGKYEHVAKLLPTCPFRLPEDLQGACNLYHQHGEDCFLIAVTEYDFPIQLALDFAEDGLEMEMREPAVYRRTVTSQALGKTYHPNGAIYLAPVKAFLRERTFFAQPLVGYEMPVERSFDIDYPYQFKIAEIMMQERNRTVHGS